MNIIVNKLKHRLFYRLKANKFFNLDAFQELKRERSKYNIIRDNTYHIKEALSWMKRAQDATPDSGVSRGYSVSWSQYFQSKGWQNSYPETTGYIIPTIFNCGKIFNDKELIKRAINMAEWEIDVQMKNGAVMGGIVNYGDPVASVFCTGMVIFGLVRSFKETKDIHFLDAAKKAADYLVHVQDQNGVFTEVKDYEFCNKYSNTYHTRVAWALIMLGLFINNNYYVDAGVKNIEYRLKFQEKNGWFRNNCLNDPDNPLVHTICYALRGFLEAGFLLNCSKYIDAVRLAADHIILKIDNNGYLGGRLDCNWQSSAKWCCLTGSAQLSIILMKLYQHTLSIKYLLSAKKLNSFLKVTHNCSSSNPGLRGGIKGSFPFDGDYGKFQVLSWATKFFIDALLLEYKINNDHSFDTN